MDDVVALTALLKRVASGGFAALVDKAPREVIVNLAMQGYAPVYLLLTALETTA